MFTFHAIRLIAYLLIGCLVMLALNEVRPVTRGEFLLGMCLWWVLLGSMAGSISRAYAKRFFEKRMP